MLTTSESVAMLSTDVQTWNRTRQQHPNWMPDLRGVDLIRLDLEGVNLRGADLSEAELWGANLAGADLRNAILCGAVFACPYLYIRRECGVNLRGADLSGAKLNGVYLLWADLNGARLCAADLQGAGLNHVDLRNTNLEGTNLKNITVADVDISGALIRNTRFTSEDDATPEGGFLQLATIKTLAEAKWEDRSLFADYLERAFRFAHRVSTLEKDKYPEEVASALSQIVALRALIASGVPSRPLVEIVQKITAELMAHLRTHPRAMHELRPRQFEELIAEILASYGWSVQLTSASQDGGYDIYAIQRDASGVHSHWIIECKKYRPDRKVGVEIVRSLYGVKSDLRVANAMLATTSHFTAGAQLLKASRYDLHLRDYENIVEWINEYRPHPNGRLYIRDHKLVFPDDA